MRKLLLLLLFLPGWTPAPGQGLTPNAGAVSAGLYTNLYFGMNYKLPEDWTVSYVALDGPCERECMLLDVRAPGEKARRVIHVTAEQMPAGGGAERFALAGASLEEMGAKKIAAPKEFSIPNRKAYRADYRSSLVNGDVYYSIVMVIIPGKDHCLVFSFSSESRKHLDSLVSELPKAVTFVGQS